MIHGVTVATEELIAHDEKSFVDAITELARRLNPGADWWLLVEQASGYVVGRLTPTGFALRAPEFGGARVQIEPERLLEARLALRGDDEAGTEVLIAPGGDGLTAYVRVSSAVVDAHVAPRLRRQLLAEPPREDQRIRTRDGFTDIARPSGIQVIIPEPWPDRGHLVLRVREHFDQDETTGAVRVALRCFAGYEALPLPKEEY
jgi:hypothetical protein